MKFEFDFYEITLDVNAYARELIKYLRKMNERAGQAWINEVVNRTPIPTWSGASRATFQKLASELGTSVPIGPIKSVKNRVDLGKSTSARSGVLEDKNDMYFGFLYATNLRYLRYNEYNHATAGPPPQPFSNNVKFTPYGFQERGKKVWQEIAKTAELPNPYRYLSRKHI